MKVKLNANGARAVSTRVVNKTDGFFAGRGMRFWLGDAGGCCRSPALGAKGWCSRWAEGLATVRKSGRGRPSCGGMVVMANPGGEAPLQEPRLGAMVSWIMGSTIASRCPQ